MVQGFTASEYGDIIIASLQEPYINTVKVLDWEIVTGLKTEYMTGVISTTVGSTEIIGSGTQFTFAFNPGDTIIIGNVQYIIDTIISPIELTITTPFSITLNNIQYYKTPDAYSDFEYEYRWSQDNTSYSEFNALTTGTAYGDLKAISFDTNKQVWIDTKFEVAKILPGNTLTVLSITFTIETVDGVIESCPNFCTDCLDPFAMTGCANIEVSCTPGNLFNPYSLGKSVNMYKQLTNMVSNIFGHSVQYFRTEPDTRTSDVILMEYSLYNVVAKENVKILVPDNEFPSEANTYDIFGMEFAEFEVHITATEFETVFGVGKKPRNKDYMFIPIINKMYEVNSIAIADEFNMSNSYWRVKLVKYQDRTSVIKNEFEIDTDTLITGVEEIFGEQIQEEYTKNTKPAQFQSVTTSYRDGNREFIDTNLKIIDYDLKNRWTVVSKNYYDLTNGVAGDNAIFYTTKSEVKINEDVSFTGWFSPQFAATSTLDYFLFGDIDAMDGFKIKLSNTSFKLELAGVTETITHGITFDKSCWYSYVFNINNKYNQVGVSIYCLNPNVNLGLPQLSSNSLELAFHVVIPTTAQYVWTASSNYTLRFNDMFMTNIRVFNTPIELEQRINVLNQYVVRDNQLATLIDNAIPSLGFQKFVNSK